MSLVVEIQNDILSEQVSLAGVLRKAKVFARHLKVESLERWVDFELNGYPSSDLVPIYRRTTCHIFGSRVTLAYRYPQEQILTSLLPDALKQYKDEDIILTSGVRSLEELSKQEFIVDMWPPEFVMMVNSSLPKGLGGYEKIWTRVERHALLLMLDSIRNRLLDFLLDLQDTYPSVNQSNTTEIQISVNEVSTEVSRTVWGIDKAVLISFIDRYFSLNELDSLCIQIGVDHDEVPGPEKSARTLRLVTYCERRGWLQKLYNQVQKLRPDVPLPPLDK